MRSIEWCHCKWHLSDHTHGFHDHVTFERWICQNDLLQQQTYFRTLGDDRQAIECYQIWWPSVTYDPRSQYFTVNCQNIYWYYLTSTASQMALFPMTLSDPNLPFKVTVFFQGQMSQNGVFYIIQLQIINVLNLQCCNVLLMCSPRW